MTVRSSLGRFGLVTTAAMQAIRSHADGTPTVLAVYVALTTHADRDEEQSWRCSVKSIAEEACCSERSVRTAKQVLVDLGLLDLTLNVTSDGDRGWDSYLVHYLPAADRAAHAAAPPASNAGGPAHVAGPPEPVAGYSSDPSTDQEAEFSAPSQAMALFDGVDLDDEFEQFWQAYGRTGPKKKARECWNRAIRKASPDEILDGLLKWAEYWRTPGAASVKWPQGWLNEERWNDEPPHVALAVSSRTESKSTAALRAAQRNRSNR